MSTEVKTMEIKKQEREKREPAAADTKKFSLRAWIEQIKQEIKAVEWTSPEELRVYTQIVVGATFFFGMGVYLVDLTIHGFLHMLSWISRLIG